MVWNRKPLLDNTKPKLALWIHTIVKDIDLSAKLQELSFQHLQWVRLTSQQWKLTPPHTWSCPILLKSWHHSFLNLSCIRTLNFEPPSVLLFCAAALDVYHLFCVHRERSLACRITLVVCHRGLFVSNLEAAHVLAKVEKLSISYLLASISRVFFLWWSSTRRLWETRSPNVSVNRGAFCNCTFVK